MLARQTFAKVLLAMVAVLVSTHLKAESVVIQVENGVRVLVITGSAFKSNWVEFLVEGRYDVTYYGGSKTYFDTSCAKGKIISRAYRQPLPATRYTAPEHLCIFMRTDAPSSFFVYYMGAFLYNPPSPGNTYHFAVRLSNFDAVRYIGGSDRDEVTMMTRSANLGSHFTQPYTAYGNKGQDSLMNSPGDSTLFGGDDDDYFNIYGFGQSREYFIDGGGGTDSVAIDPLATRPTTINSEKCYIIGESFYSDCPK